MIPLALFLLACATVYVGAVEAAFTTLMRLSLRLGAERRGRLDRLGYLDDPLRLFVPVRVLQSVLGVAVAVTVTVGAGARDVTTLALIAAGLVSFVLVCGYLLPAVIVRRDPEQVLEALLPSFQVPIAVLQPLTRPLIRLLRRESRRVNAAVTTNGGASTAADEHESADGRAEKEEQEERQLLQSVFEFGETLVREVMTPRPDIVAVKADATLDELRALFKDEQYSRLPVFEHSLDTVLGFVFVKDLVTLSAAPGDERVVDRLLRPAHTVPETKRVAGPAEGTAAGAGPERHRARRVRGHGRPGHHRGPDRGDRRRDPGRVRRGGGFRSSTRGRAASSSPAGSASTT